MQFNSGTFLQFFAAFLLLHYCVRRRLPARNVLIVLASFLFYGWWRPVAETGRFDDSVGGYVLATLWQMRFLGLLVFTSVLDFAVALWLDRTAPVLRRKLLLAASVTANLGVLGFFKYCDFFIESIGAVMTQLGWTIRPGTLGLVLPVGISFYTFQSMSYTIDVYRREIPATRSLVHFIAFVSFFPQLVAGPIERAKHLLPQFARPLRITKAMLEEGVWLCLWGLFKKVVLADNLAPLVEMVYGHPAPGALLVVLATLAFGVQIYCDFSGYSDMARGIAQLLGFDLMLNFNLPYAAANLRDFWRRWHISLSTWLRDYLYVSLGGSRLGRTRTLLNLFVTMLLGGLWHGAAWNFVLWGLWHGGGLVVHRAWSESSRAARSGGFPLLNWMWTMLFVFYGWLLFRADSWAQIRALTVALGDFSTMPWARSYVINLVIFTLPLVCVQIWQARTKDLLAPMRLSPWPRAVLQGSLLLGIVLFWESDRSPFIYFQF